jgi:amino acid transporter
MSTSSLAQQISSMLKVLLLIALILAAFFASPTPAAPAREAAMPGTGNLLGSFAAAVVATQLFMETYAGWNSGCYFSEETTDPGRTLP